jgi:hypothetical protein
MLISPGTLSQQQIRINLQKKFAHLCYRLFYQFDFPRNCDAILGRLVLRTLHSRRRHLDALFLINVFNNTIDCQSILDTVSLRVPYKLIRAFSIFSVSKALRSTPPARCSTMGNKVYQFMDIFSTKTTSVDDLLCYAI